MVYLKNADATKLAATCAPPWQPARARHGARRASASSSTAPASTAPRHGRAGLHGQQRQRHRQLGAGAPSTASSNQPSTGGQIQADPSTNSLIITAPEPQYRQLRNVIDKLDGRRAQVLVEA